MREVVVKRVTPDVGLVAAVVVDRVAPVVVDRVASEVGFVRPVVPDVGLVAAVVDRVEPDVGLVAAVVVRVVPEVGFVRPVEGVSGQNTLAQPFKAEQRLKSSLAESQQVSALQTSGLTVKTHLPSAIWQVLLSGRGYPVLSMYSGQNTRPRLASVAAASNVVPQFQD
jgi:hypothetical protein